MLELRGNYLKDGEYKKVEKIQREMTEYKNKNLPRLMKPTRAFLIFQFASSFQYMMEKYVLEKDSKDKKSFEFYPQKSRPNPNDSEQQDQPYRKNAKLQQSQTDQQQKQLETIEEADNME